LANPWAWTVEEGDTFTFEAFYRGQSSNSRPDTIVPDWDNNGWLEIVGDPFLLITITSLPEIPIWTNAGGFADIIINPIKVNTTFLNGSPIRETIRLWVNNRISNAILPIGNWQRIESFYANPTRPHSTYTPISEFEAHIYDDCFFISYGGQSHHITDQWIAYLDIETGLPMNISDFYCWLDGDTFRADILILRMVYPEGLA